jgi:hypothetical protein
MRPPFAANARYGGRPAMVFRTSMAFRDLIPWSEEAVGNGGRRWLVVGGVVAAVAAVVVLMIVKPW